MIQFNYEYQVIDTHNMGVHGLRQRLNDFGNAGWMVNCSIGTLVILSRAKMEYIAPEGIMSKQEAFERVE
jgi:hypothetical protein